jgi:enoyl-CoA hydratase/3-hydroxyacyl-CoA dehydrogenase
MIVGVIGSGSIGPDLAYGFLSALSRVEGAKVYLNDINPAALEAGVGRIKGYLKKGVSRGKLSERAAKAIEGKLRPTLELTDLADCEYVLEAATEQLPIKRQILASMEAVLSPSCLIGFATSGIPRAEIARDAKHPERCFVNHPFFPAWRSLPIEIVGSGDEALTQKMVDTISYLGKVPVVTADVACFAADDIFCNYITEAARIVAEGIANPAQVDRIVNDAVGGGGPFNVMDLTRGNLLTVHCQELMREAPTGSAWFEPPALLAEQGNTPWHDRRNPLDATYDEALKTQVLDRIMAVLFGRTFFVLDYEVCNAADTDWMTRTALGFSVGILSLAREWGMERVKALCEAYAANNPAFEVTKSVREAIEPRFYPNLRVGTPNTEGVVTVTLQRPEAKNALNASTLADLREVLEGFESDPTIKGVVLTGYEGAIAGADINELATLKTHAEAEALCLRGQGVLNYIERYPKPVVAAVNGPVMGGGAELSMACHARVVGPELTMSQPEVNLGIIPGYGGTQRLPRLVGLERAWAMLRVGQPINAELASAWGWADAVAPSAQALTSTAADLITAHLKGERSAEARPVAGLSEAPMSLPEGGLASLPAVELGHRSLKIDNLLIKALREGLTKPLYEGLALEASIVGEAVETVDCGIGMTNFAQNGPRVPALFMHE